MKPPAPEQQKTQEPPKEAPRRGEEQIVYIKLDELHAFKNHPFQVRDDDEMRAMVSSVKDKGVTQPAIVRPREDGLSDIIDRCWYTASCLFPSSSEYVRNLP